VSTQRIEKGGEFSFSSIVVAFSTSICWLKSLLFILISWVLVWCTYLLSVLLLREVSTGNCGEFN